MNQPLDATTVKLHALARATDRLAAREGFSDRVMATLEQLPASRTPALRLERRSGRLALAAAALAASVALAWAQQARSSVDRALVAAWGADDATASEASW